MMEHTPLEPWQPPTVDEVALVEDARAISQV